MACLTGSRCCHECGMRLGLECPHCSAVLPPTAHSCDQCGLEVWISSGGPRCAPSLRGKQVDPREYLAADLQERILSQRDYIIGRRKLVAVLLVDMVGYVFGPAPAHFEEGSLLLDQFYAMIIQKICDYEGLVNDVVDHMILALFGAPIPLEDAPQRAIRAALAIHRELFGFGHLISTGDRAPGIPMRTGIGTGPVVVESIGKDLRVSLTAVEDTIRVACRMVGLAEPGTIYVTEDTFKLTEGLFRFEALGEEVAGALSGKVNAYRVLGSSSTRTRFDVHAERGLTRFIGRDRDSEALLDAYEKAKDGRGQVCSIAGDAGVGKSRLLYEFRKAVATGDVTFLEGKCLSYGRGAAYHPIIDILKSHYDIHDGDSDSEIRRKVKRELKRLAVDEEKILPYVLELLSVKESGIDEIATSAAARKEGIVEALRLPLLRAAQLGPVVIAIEDLHWMDGSSEDIVNQLVDTIPESRVLLVCTYRTEYVHTWGAKSFHTQVNLAPLSSSDSLVMVAHLVGTYEIASNLAQLILEKTAGVPFYIEEFVRSLKDLQIVERDGNRYSLREDQAGLTIASTIQDVIMARVNALPVSAKQVLQVGSVIEKEFSHRLIARVTDIPENELVARLSILRYEDLIYERGIYPESTYVFKHALIRDVCYQSLEDRTRRAFHRRIGEVMEQHFPEIAAGSPEVLGHHFTEARLLEPAATYWQKAGEIAVRRSANREAIDHFVKALSMLKALPESLERTRQELNVQLALGPTLMAAKGYAAPAVEQAYLRARELCEQLGEWPMLYTVLRGLWGVYIVRARLQDSLELGKQCLALAERMKSPPLFIWSHQMVGQTATHLGELALARQQFDEGLRLYDAQKRRTPRALQDPAVACLSYKSSVLWLLGYPDQALAASRRAVELARRLSHPFSLAYALIFAAVVCQFGRMAHECIEYAEAAWDLASDQGILYWSAVSRVLRALARIEIGDRQEAIALAHRALTAYAMTGSKLMRPYWLGVVAEARAKEGETYEAIRLLEEAQAVMETSGERWAEAELHRLRGELLLSLSPRDVTGGEACLKKALETARRHQARAWELRATVSMSRLRQMQGRTDQARTLLEQACGAFTEGFGAPDFREAEILLEELG